MWHVRGDRIGAKTASVTKTEGNKTFGNSGLVCFVQL